MNKRLITLFFPFLIFPRLWSQILPVEGSNLNYRIIGFTFPPEQQVSRYSIEIALGNYNTEDSFKKNIILSPFSTTNKIIAEVPSFGCMYTWHMIYKTAGKVIKKSGFYHFSTGMVPEVDRNLNRFRILKKAEKYKDAFVFTDPDRALYDMNGNPVWYLPGIEDINFDRVAVRDLKITPFGTITFVIDDLAGYEINYNGAVLWKTPKNGIVSGDSAEHYHHEFTRLNNGHYMILGQETVFWKLPAEQDTSLIIVPKDNINPADADFNSKYRQGAMSTIIEYDTQGHALWSWKCSNTLNGSGILYQKTERGGQQINPHENSFFFNEETSCIYLSCKNISSIIKIKYPDGYLMNIYNGAIANTNTNINSLFCGQHSCRCSKDGYLYLYSNNSCIKGTTPTILMMKEPSAKNDSLEKIWEYKCVIDSNIASTFPSGGNVLELPDKSFFVSMAFPSNNVFIVNPAKKILWSAVAEKWDQDNKKWGSVNLYRASIITNRKQLEQLIWNAESKR